MADTKLQVTLDFATQAATRAARTASSAIGRSLASVSAVADRVRGGIARMTSAIFSIRGAAVAAGAALIGAIGGRAVIRAANALEDSMSSLANAMARSGEFSQSAFQDMRNFANELQATSRFGADAILGQMAFSQSLGLTSSQARNAASASADLAAALGIGLEQANRKVARTIGGTAGELRELIPELRNMTREQLMAGEAIDLIAAKFKGAAIASINTYAGATAQLGNTFSDFQAAIGAVVTRNPLMIKAIQAMTRGFAFLEAKISENLDSIVNFVNDGINRMINAFKSSVPAIQSTINVTGFLGEALLLVTASVLRVASAFASLEPVVALMRFITEQVLRAVFGLIELRMALARAADLLERTFGGAADNVARIEEEADRARLAIAGMANEVENIDFTKISKGIEQSASFTEDLGKKFREIGTATSEVVGNVGDMLQEISRTGALKIEPSFNATQGNVDDLADQVNSKIDLKAALEAEIVPTIGKSLIEGLAKGGEDGAKAFVSSAAMAAGQAFLGPMGQAAGPIVDLLMQGPEAVRETIDSFFEALPELIQTLVESIPALIDALIDNIPVLVEALVEALPDLINALVRAVPKIVVELTKLMPQISLAIINGIISNIPQIARGFIDGFLKGIPQIIIGIANGAMRAIGNLFSTITGGLLGFSKGGMVPSGFPNDSFPARLESGEVVIDRSLTKQLSNFLNGGNQGMAMAGAGGGQSESILMSILQEMREPASTETSFNLDDRGFANAVLRMDKLNRRTRRN